MENVSSPWLNPETISSLYYSQNVIYGSENYSFKSLNTQSNLPNYLDEKTVLVTQTEPIVNQAAKYTSQLCDISEYYPAKNSVFNFENIKSEQSESTNYVNIDSQSPIDLDKTQDQQYNISSDFILNNDCAIKSEASSGSETNFSDNVPDSVDEVISMVIQKCNEGTLDVSDDYYSDEVNFLRRFTCDKCNQEYTTFSALWRHISGTHLGVRPNMCSLCDKTFARGDYLAKHMLHHTKEKPHKCSVCEKRFTQASSLNKHLLLHNGVRPYKCSVCNHRFTERIKLVNHARRHTGEKPHQCYVCDKMFSELGNLNRHIRTHTGERPYICGVCDKAFTESSVLTRHARTHSGVKPYVCQVCYKGYTVASFLAKHMEKHGPNAAVS